VLESSGAPQQKRDPLDGPENARVLVPRSEGRRVTPHLETRRILLEGVDFFVRGAVRLSGVQQIALIGSLTTDKIAPKDADVLVWVEDAMDLTPLAALGRRFIGRMQSRGRGADVFLANPRGEYIGRTCLWRLCRPGVRVACDADHCGRRSFLHDDIRTVHLPSELLAAPPVLLWPEAKMPSTVPEDVGALIKSWRGAI
jgi:hypothetical protein